MSSKNNFSNQTNNNSQKQDKIADLKNQIKELENKYKRARADYANLERRFNKEREEMIKFANSVLIMEFLKILDDLEKAQSHLKDKGLDLIIKRFKNIIEAQGLEEIKVLNKEFNPETMECVERVGDGEKVIEVVEKGYKMGEKTLRVAKVRVG